LKAWSAELKELNQPKGIKGRLCTAQEFAKKHQLKICMCCTPGMLQVQQLSQGTKNKFYRNSENHTPKNTLLGNGRTFRMGGSAWAEGRYMVEAAVVNQMPKPGLSGRSQGQVS
jgi:hypothetical protein